MSAKTDQQLADIAKTLRRLTWVLESWVVPELRKLAMNTTKEEEEDTKDGDQR